MALRGIAGRVPQGGAALMRRHLVRLALLALVLGVGGFLALGLPGFLVLAVAVPLAVPLEGDQVWPAALVISLVGPFAILPADLAVMRLRPAPRGVRVLLTAAAALLLVLAATVAGLRLPR